MRIELVRFWQTSHHEPAPHGPPLALGCLKARLRGAGFESRISDVVYGRNIQDDFGRWSAGTEHFTFEAPNLGLILATLAHWRDHESLSGLTDDADFRRLLTDYCACHAIIESYWLQTFSDKLLLCQSTAARIVPCDLLGVNVWYLNVLESVILALLVRRASPQTFVVFGGAHLSQSTGLREVLLQLSVCDAVVMGEGEGPVVAIAERLAQRDLAGIATVPGVATHDAAAGVHRAVPARSLPDLDGLELPDWSDLDLGNEEIYRPHTLPHFSSRGCVARCAFCSEWRVHGPRFRQKRPETVATELEKLQQRYGAFRIDFQDSMLNPTPQWPEALAALIEQRGLIVQWSSFFRANITERAARRCYGAGLRSVALGIESFSDSSLQAMHKQASVASSVDAVRVFLRNGIHVHMEVIVNFPQGDMSDAAFDRERAAFENLLRELDAEGYRGLVSFGVFPFDVRPGSLVAHHPERLGVEVRPWSAARIGHPLADACAASIAKISRSFLLPIPTEVAATRLMAMSNTALWLAAAKRRYEPYDPTLWRRFEQQRGL